MVLVAKASKSLNNNHNNNNLLLQVSALPGDLVEIEGRYFFKMSKSHDYL